MDIKISEQEDFEERLVKIKDSDNVVIIECTEGSDVTYDDLQVAAQEFVQMYNISSNDLYDEKGRFVAIDSNRVIKDNINEAIYVALPKKASTDRFINGLNEQYKNVFTYVVTDGHSARNFEIEELDGGIAGRDLTLSM